MNIQDAIEAESARIVAYVAQHNADGYHKRVVFWQTEAICTRDRLIYLQEMRAKWGYRARVAMEIEQ